MEIEQQYFEIFAGLTRAHGVYELAEPAAAGQKQSGRAYTVMEELTPELWRRHLAGEQGLGVVPIRDNGTVRWGAIDVDVALDCAALEKQCADYGMPVTVCRSKSGGAHVLLFGKEDLPAVLVREKLLRWMVELFQWAVRAGYNVGKLKEFEVFPKQTSLASERDVGNWLNMPYFDAERTTRYALRHGKALPWREFPVYAAKRAVTAEELAALTLKGVNAEQSFDFEDGPPCLVTLASQGMTEGSRNSLLFNMGVYSRLRYGKDGSEEEWRSHLLDYNQKYMSPPLPDSEVRGVLKSVAKKDYFYTCQQAPIHAVCQRRACHLKKFGIASLAEVPDVALDKLVKNLTVPVTWIAVLGERRLELTTEELLSQTHFRRACLEKLSILPKTLKQDTWDKVLREKLEHAEVVEVPPDASPEGQFLHHVEVFCTGRAQARAKDELLQGKPWSDNGRTHFRAADLARFLDQQHFRALSQREIWVALTRLSVQSHNFELKGKKVKCWSLPEFDKQTDNFDVPRKPVEEEF